MIHYDQMVKSNLETCVSRFSELTGLTKGEIQKIAFWQGGMPFHLYSENVRNAISENGLIYLYKTGQITTESFIEKMLELIDQRADADEFIQAWNSQCQIQPQVIADLKQLSDLQKNYGFSLHVIAGTNPLQDRYIKQQLAENGIELLFSTTYSFDEGTLESDKLKSIALKQDIPKALNGQEYTLVDILDNEQPLLSLIKDSLQLRDAPLWLSHSQQSTQDSSLLAMVGMKESSRDIHQEEGPKKYGPTF